MQPVFSAKLSLTLSLQWNLTSWAEKSSLWSMTTNAGMENVHVCREKGAAHWVSPWGLQDAGFLLPVSAPFVSACSGTLAWRTGSRHTSSAASWTQRRFCSRCRPGAFPQSWWRSWKRSVESSATKEPSMKIWQYTFYDCLHHSP